MYLDFSFEGQKKVLKLLMLFKNLRRVCRHKPNKIWIDEGV